MMVDEWTAYPAPEGFTLGPARTPKTRRDRLDRKFLDSRNPWLGLAKDVVVAEYFTLGDVVERDAWVCGICRAEVPHGDREPGCGPLKLQVDHVEPMGHHVLDNVRATHAYCNGSRESGRGPGDDWPPLLARARLALRLSRHPYGKLPRGIDDFRYKEVRRRWPRRGTTIVQLSEEETDAFVREWANERLPEEIEAHLADVKMLR